MYKINITKIRLNGIDYSLGLSSVETITFPDNLFSQLFNTSGGGYGSIIKKCSNIISIYLYGTLKTAFENNRFNIQNIDYNIIFPGYKGRLDGMVNFATGYTGDIHFRLDQKDILIVNRGLTVVPANCYMECFINGILEEI